MLKDAETFARLESALFADGARETFEATHGPLTGRAMITLTDIPEEIQVTVGSMEDIPYLYAFEASFDFTDTTLGIAMCVNSSPLKVASPLWHTPAAEEAPDELTRFFLETLAANVPGDGTLSLPIFVFMGEKEDLTLVPPSGGKA